MSWRKFVVAVAAVFICCSPIGFTNSLVQISTDTVQFWTNSLGQQLKSRCDNASGINELNQFYEDSTASRKIQLINGTDLVLTTAEKIKRFLSVRYQAAERIKFQAQAQFVEAQLINQSFNSGCDAYSFYNAKTVNLYKERPNAVFWTVPEDENSTSEYIGPNTTYFIPMYNEWSKYYQVPVSLNASTVHVPTNIYECTPSILSSISWTKDLDTTFAQNYPELPTSWQYFASSEGFMRFYPGSKWRYDGMDMYDARLTEWYTGAAATPKSVIILLDSSGSMTGLRMEIAKTTVRKIMESLQENDFFNLIAFGNDSVFVDSACENSNGTLIQATSKNIRRITNALDNVTIGEIANFSRAFSLAFDVLIQANKSRLTGGDSNNAIMVVTDGAPESFPDVFKKYNWMESDVDTEDIDKWTRVFSYLIGQEVTLSNKQHVEWMACANKGYFYHIGTMADVHDYVQDYVRIMARPLVVHNVSHYAWTGVHVNMPLTTENNAFNSHAKSTDWIRVPSNADRPRLTVSVALPVYDLRPEARNHGHLLGVAGVDVNLDEILELIPRHKLGVHGYSFIINNNGFVVSHPDLSAWVEPCDNEICLIAREGNPALKDNGPKPDYKNVDISYLEQEEDPLQGNIATLRDSMINGSSGLIMARVKKFYSKDYKRVYIQSQSYYYAPIAKTPYSIAIVLVEPSDSKQVLTETAPDPNAFDWCRMNIADWNYCQFSVDERSSASPLALLKGALLDFKQKPKCDKDLIKSVVYDAHATRGMPAVWAKAALDKPCNQVDTKAKKICEVQRQVQQLQRTLVFDMVVLGTRSGVTRYQEREVKSGLQTGASSLGATENESCQRVDMFANYKTSIDSDYFRRAATSRTATRREHLWIFDVKVPPHFEYIGNTSQLYVTASKGVYIKDDQRGRASDSDDILVSVVGLNIQYNSLYEMLDGTTKICSDSMDCNSSMCQDGTADCYLLDDNGYIIVSPDDRYIGKFFGDVDYQILLDMSEQGLFDEVLVTDYQALCTICRTTTETSSASIMLDPFRYIYKILWWSLTRTALFLLEFSLYDWWHCIYYATASGLESSMNGNNTVQPLIPWAYPNVQYMGRNSRVLNASNTLYDCISCKVYSNSSIESLGYNANTSFVPHLFLVGDAQNHTEICKTTQVDCDRSYVVNRVPNTNLYLLVLEANCKCDTQMEEYCVESHELFDGCTDESMSRYRRPPPFQKAPDESQVYTPYPSNIDRFRGITNSKNKKSKKGSKPELPPHEDTQTCGRATTSNLSILLLLILQVIIIHWNSR